MTEFIDQDVSGARFRRLSLSQARLHSVRMQDVKITDAWIDNVEISGSIRSLIVNGVDVASFLREQMHERYPELQMLQATDPDGMRAAWDVIVANAEATVERARRLPTATLEESVDDEYTFVETLRHLVFAADRWFVGPILGQAKPFHPLGVPPDVPEQVWHGLGLDPNAEPSLDEVLELRRERLDGITALLRDASDEDLDRAVESPNGGQTTVRGCLQVLMNEEWAHNRYANRDLDVLTGVAGSSG